MKQWYALYVFLYSYDYKFQSSVPAGFFVKLDEGMYCIYEMLHLVTIYKMKSWAFHSIVQLNV